MQLITSLADVNPDWLTDVLRRASVLGGGSVADIAPEVASTSFCTIARLRATYSPDGACPERLSLKFSLPTHPVSGPRVVQKFSSTATWPHRCPARSLAV